MAKVLIADDERLATTVLFHFLTDRGYDVRTALSGEEALEVGRQYGPDLLITDYLLGGDYKGTDVAKLLQAEDPRLHVLLISGFPSDVLSPETVGLAKLRVFGKPFDLDELADTVGALVGRPPQPVEPG